jgi:aminoglycoside phosphotransferase (APT) family kinase protein
VRTTPQTFLHGDWKLGNLGTAPDGRTILLDWAYPGEGPVCHELAWYLALNRARLPVGETKESTIERFRAALGRHGVETAGWWERQVGLCLLGALLQFGWEKALGDDDELGWWCDRAREGARFL